MKDRFFNMDVRVERLFKVYKEYNNLFVAFDFDHTVFDYDGVGDTYPKVEAIIKRAAKYSTLILFTARENEKLEFAVNYCIEHGFAPDLVNENPVLDTRKPYWNILLDDTAGLWESYQVLSKVLDKIDHYVKN
jgi:hypothetical protein